MKWKATTEDFDLIGKIADLTQAVAAEVGIEYRPQDCLMDLTAAHLNAYRLDLSGLLSATCGDFAHDVFGIRRYIDRRTGQLTDCFVPRYAVRDSPDTKRAEKGA